MIFKKYVFKLLILALILVYSCGKQGGDNEPNNTIDQASEVNYGEQFSLKIDPLGDADWFKVKVTNQGYIQVNSANRVEGVQLQVSFAQYQEWEEQKEKWCRSWHPVPDALFVKDAGDYYLKIKDEWDDGFSAEEFLVKIDFLEEFDFTEPNNSVEEAKMITFGEQFVAAVYPVGDQDWFKVKAPAQGYLEVVSKNELKGIQTEVRFVIYDEWSDPKTKDIRGWKHIPQSCFIPDSGEYYIVMHDAWDDETIAEAFDLKINFIPEFDLLEPNNNIENAKLIKLDSINEIAIFPQGDKDYFKFTTEKNKIKVFVKDHENIQPEMQLLTVDPENPEKYITVKNWTGFPAEIDVESGKEYYIVIHDAWDDNESKKLFQLKVE